MMTASLSRFGPRTLAGRAMRLPLHLLPRNMVVTVRSGVNEGMRWVVGSSIHGCWLGHYEIEKQALIRRLVRPGMTAFDIGANAGFYTLAFSRLVGDAGRVWAFEPFGENSAHVLRHLALNGITNATLVQVAVSATAGIAAFNIGGNNAIGRLTSAESQLLVPTVSLDSLIASGRLPVPDVVKMDVEGAESDVLAGARELLARRTSSFVIALHGVEPMRSCARLLRDAGYVPLRLDGRPLDVDGEFVDEIYAGAPAR